MPIVPNAYEECSSLYSEFLSRTFSNVWRFGHTARCSCSGVSHHSQHVEVIVEKKQRLASSDVHREHALEDDRRVLSQLHRSRPTAVHVAQHQPREHLRRRQLEPDDERREF